MASPERILRAAANGEEMESARLAVRFAADRLKKYRGENDSSCDAPKDCVQP